MEHHGAADLSAADLAVLRRAAAALAAQAGRGIPRHSLVALAGTATRRLSVYAPDPGPDGTPALAVVMPPRPGAHPVFAALTDRERQVAELLVAGHSNQQIARALTVTIGTVKDHVHAILTKTGLPSRTAVGAAWLSGGLDGQSR